VGHHTEAFVGIDTSKLRNAVAIAEGGRGGEVRYLGEFAATEAAVRKLVAKLSAKYDKLTVCYEAGPTGILALQTAQEPRPGVPSGGSLARPEEARRTGEDEPARCGKPRQARR